MKPWIKILMWLGLGSVCGAVIGDRIGYRRGYEAGMKEKNQSEEVQEQAYEEDAEKAEEAIAEYRGNDTEQDWVREAEAHVGEDPDDMVPKEEIEIDADIPQLHPTHLTPEIIGEEEYNANIWQYDLENLIFYEMDEVLYNETTQAIVENPDNVIGIGTLFEFGGDPNNPTETIFVKNDTFGVLFRIDRLDAAFCDAVDGSFPPQDDEEDDFGENDLG